MKLTVDKSVPPKIQPQRGILFAKREQFEAIFKELEDSDIIELKYGPTEWVSNVVLTPKADSSYLTLLVVTKQGDSVHFIRKTPKHHFSKYLIDFSAASMLQCSIQKFNMETTTSTPGLK